VSLQEAAVVLGVSVATLRRLVWAGKLPTVRLTRRVQIDVRDLDRLIQQGKEGGMR
jgi:excisionase family DNA binding protein